MTSEHIALRKAAEMASEAMDMDAEDADKISWERLAKIVAAGVALKEAMAQLDRKCEAGPSLQDLWNCWDAVHGGQKPTAWMSPTGDTIVHVKNVGYTPNWTDYYTIPLYIYPTPIPEGWVEAAIAWEVCASIHRKWAKGKDALYSTRQADFVKHAEHARAMLAAAPKYEEQ